MTASETAALLVDTIRELAATRAELRIFETIAVRAVLRSGDLFRQNEGLRRQLEHLRREVRGLRARSLSSDDSDAPVRPLTAVKRQSDRAA